MVFIRAAKIQTRFGAHNPQFWVKRTPFSPKRYPHVAMNGEWRGETARLPVAMLTEVVFVSSRRDECLFVKERLSPREGTNVSSRWDVCCLPFRSARKYRAEEKVVRKHLRIPLIFVPLHHTHRQNLAAAIGNVLLQLPSDGRFHRIFTPPSPSLLPCPFPLFSLSVPSSP